MYVESLNDLRTDPRVTYYEIQRRAHAHAYESPPRHRHISYRRIADSSFARVLIWPFCTFRGFPSRSPSLLPSRSPSRGTRERSVVLVAASIRRGDGFCCGRSLIVPSVESGARGPRRLGGPGLRGIWVASSGTPDMNLMFAGSPLGLPPLSYGCFFPDWPVWLLRQLPEDRLVAAVDTLRELALLYFVNAEDDVPALAIELRQLFDDAMELALDASGRPLRVLEGETPRLLAGETLRLLAGETARWDRASALDTPRRSRLLTEENGEPEGGPHVLLLFDSVLAAYGDALGRRPRCVKEPISPASARLDEAELLGCRLSSMLATLLAVEDFSLPLASESASSEASALLSAALLPLPKLSFHFDDFFEIEDEETDNEDDEDGNAAVGWIPIGGTGG